LFFCFRTGFRSIKGGRLIRLVRKGMHTDQTLFLLRIEPKPGILPYVLGNKKCLTQMVYKKCWLYEQIFSFLTIFIEAILRVVCPTVKSSIPQVEKLQSSQHMHVSFLHNHKTEQLKLDLPLCGLIKKFRDTSFFTYTHVRLKMSQRTSLTKLYLYLKFGSSLQ
jgi:hypothetical protein